MSIVVLFHITSYMLNMFQTLIYPSSGACDYSVELPHWSCVLVSVCVGVSVWLGWHGIRVVGEGKAVLLQARRCPDGSGKLGSQIL